MFFLGKTTFSVSGSAQIYQLYHVNQSNMLNVYHFPTSSFLSFCLYLPALCHLNRLSHLLQSEVSLQYPLPNVVIATNATPHQWAFYIPGLWGSHLHVVAPVLVLCARCIFPCKNSRLLHSCCIKWSLSEPLRWLPYIWTTVLLNLLHVIMVVQLLFLLADLLNQLMQL